MDQPPGKDSNGPKLSSNYGSHFSAAAKGYRAHFIQSIQQGYKNEMAKAMAETEQRHTEIKAKCEQDIKDLKGKALEDIATLKQHWADRSRDIHTREREEIEDFVKRFDADPVAAIMRHEEVAGKVDWNNSETTQQMTAAMEAASTQKQQQQSNMSTVVPLSVSGFGTPAMPMQNLAPQAQMATPASTPGLSKSTIFRPSSDLPNASRPPPSHQNSVLNSQSNSPRLQVWRPPPDSDDEDDQPIGLKRPAPSSQSQPMTGHPTGSSTAYGLPPRPPWSTSGLQSIPPPQQHALPPKPQEHRRHKKPNPYPTTRLTEAQVTFLNTNIEVIKSQSYSRFFCQPVDRHSYGGIHDYYEVVKKPMYLALLQYNLAHDRYESMRHFMQDFGLILENTRRYNGENHEVTQTAYVMEREFKRLVKEFPGGLLKRDGKDKAGSGIQGEPIEID